MAGVVAAPLVAVLELAELLLAVLVLSAPLLVPEAAGELDAALDAAALLVGGTRNSRKLVPSETSARPPSIQPGITTS